MQREEYENLADGESRHAIRLGSATNVKIEGLSFEDTGGDGITITQSFEAGTAKNYCEDVLIKNCFFSNNYRQGLSISSVKNAIVENCEFTETRGTLPEDGIDIEPFNSTQRIENVLITGCRMYNNYGKAIQFALQFLDDTSQDVSVVVEDTYIANNHDPSNTFARAEIDIRDNGDNGVDGSVTFNNCYVYSSEWRAVNISKTIESFDVNFNNCVFQNVSKTIIGKNSPVFFRIPRDGTNIAPTGGVSFRDCSIFYDVDIPFLDINDNLETPNGLSEVNGNFFIVNPFEVNFNVGEGGNNNDLTYEYFPSFPETALTIATTGTEFLESDGSIPIMINRTSDVLFPIAVDLGFSGEAVYGLDINRDPNFRIIPFGVEEMEYNIILREDGLEESTESLAIQVLNNASYQAATNGILNLFILDMEQEEEEIEPPPPPLPAGFCAEPEVLGLFPNPTYGAFSIQGNEKIGSIQIFDSFGRLFKTYTSVADFSQSVNVSVIGLGVFYVRLKNDSGEIIATKKRSNIELDSKI